MVPPNLWENQTAIKTLYAKCVEPVCEMYGITRMELDILLFLANNPQFDTAADIVEHKYLTKSHVSTSLKSLEQRGFISKGYETGNRKSVHLSIRDMASVIIRDGKEAKTRFFRILFQGFSESDILTLKQYYELMAVNIRTYLKN
ncbi:MAG: MarR family transcriptional regulator [Candidatus Choladocola sp.]|nr:MarR family transcriptional regulator [Candidatus Choladocola sp.]